MIKTRFSIDMQHVIVDAYKAGSTLAALGHVFGTSHETIRTIIKKLAPEALRATGKRGTGLRPRKLNELSETGKVLASLRVGKRAQRTFDAETVKGWRKRILAGETYDSVADNLPFEISNSSVYYHVSKLGPLPSLSERRRGAPDPVVKIPTPVRRAAEIVLASALAPPSVASRMAGRARIPRRIDRLEGIEAQMVGVLHPAFASIKRTALAWATPAQADAQARVIANDLIENGLLLDGVVEGGMPCRKRTVE